MKKTAITSALILLSVMMLPLIVSTVQTDMAAAEATFDNVYVDASRPVDGDGSSWATAKKSIQSGINIVNTYGTVHVAAGTYYENIHINDTFDLSGAGALTTIIDGRGLDQVIYVASIVDQTNVISGFTIQNGHIYVPTPPPTGEGPLQGDGPGMAVGGGVYVALDHMVTMNDCTIRNNVADFLGGGIYNAGELTLNRCTISGNSAALVGGGIANFPDVTRQSGFGYVSNSTMKLVNCTVSGNSVTRTAGLFTGNLAAVELGIPLSFGGGVYNGGMANFINVTIANNSVPATSLGGGFANVPLACTNDKLATATSTRAFFKNTIVANNTPDNGYNVAPEAEITSLGYNLDSQDTCGFHNVTDQVNTNPLLGPLQDNGGPTSTLGICINSPAYNRGGNSDLATDQRGVARPQAAVYDIGAYELVPVSVTTLDGTSVPVNSAIFNGNLTSGISLQPVYVSFQYGSSPGNYTGETSSQLMTAVGPFSATVNGLPIGTTYFRARAVSNCTVYGREKSMLILPPQQYVGAPNSSYGGPTATPVGLPNIQVVSAQISTANTTPGSPVTVTASVANRGTVNGTTAVKLYVNGQEETSRGITVNSGSNTPVTFTISRNEPGTYSVYVGGISAGSFTVEELNNPDIILYISGALVLFALALGIVFFRRRQQGV